MRRAVLSACVCILLTAPASGEDVVYEVGRDFNPARAKTERCTVSVAGGALRMDCPADARNATLILPAPAGGWDVSRYEYLEVHVENRCPTQASFAWMVENEDPKNCRRRYMSLRPMQKARIRVRITTRVGRDAQGNEIRLIAMRSLPWGRAPRPQDPPFDPRRVARFHFYSRRQTAERVFRISSIRAGGPAGWNPPKDGPFFPFVDRFGQYIHGDWPGKIHTEADLKQHAEAELRDLAAHSRPPSWNRYGGWQDGPTLEATGHFRVQKHGGKWWLVDPDGKLFFSHGIGAVRIAGEFTPVDERRRYFARLPDRQDAEFGRFYANKRGRTGPFRGKSPLCFNFSDANMLPKYGAAWLDTSIDLAHQRLPSWGHNTLGNWTTPSIYEKARTAYTAHAAMGKMRWLDGKTMWQGRTFRDVFDPSFRTALEQLTRNVAKTAGDPWCIGYFVDNEMPWDHHIIPKATLESPADQPGKIAFVEMLKKHYVDIAALNRAWRTEHASWDSVLQHRTPPQTRYAGEDFDAYLTAVAERYFPAVRNAVRKGAPKKLYLGCRFNTFNKIPAAVAARYCDVVSYNYYRAPDEVASFQFPGDTDVPLIIGEWHFCALDRGMFDYGICHVKDQEARAKHYVAYMKAALGHPQIVGAHWFRYKDQSLTGRVADGANAQNGFLDIADTPYPETVEASREVGRNLYEWRGHGTGPGTRAPAGNR